MAQNIKNEHNSSRHVDFNTPMPTHTSRQPKTNCLMRAGGCVIEDAIKCNSWGKSGCEWMCHFPNTGGLHCTSGDAPLKTGVFAGRSIEEDAVGCNTHPPWCHMSKSNSSSSRRTQVAANAYKDKPHKSARRTTKHKRGVNADRKRYKQIRYLKDVQVCNVTSNRRVQYVCLDYIRKNIVVCNGGDTTSNAIKNISALNSVHYLQIRDGDLWVADTANASIGLRFILPG
jgi:hypothetical protein